MGKIKEFYHDEIMEGQSEASMALKKRRLKLDLRIYECNIAEQLKTQGFEFDQKLISFFERDLDDLNRLSRQGYFTGTVWIHAKRTLWRKILRHIRETNHLKHREFRQYLII
jgi:hypothetical protein